MAASRAAVWYGGVAEPLRKVTRFVAASKRRSRRGLVKPSKRSLCCGTVVVIVWLSSAVTYRRLRSNRAAAREAGTWTGRRVGSTGPAGTPEAEPEAGAGALRAGTAEAGARAASAA